MAVFDFFSLQLFDTKICCLTVWLVGWLVGQMIARNVGSFFFMNMFPL